MKRVSFEIAKALKEAGYPQFSGCHYYNSNGERFVNPEEGTLEEDDYFAPTAIDVWLWLWREKKYAITLECIDNKDWATGKVGFFDDPEKAIIAEIQHIVDCNLLK